MNTIRVTGLSTIAATALLVFLVLTGTSGCSDPAAPHPGLVGNEERVTITQGVWGNVRFWEGDFMPVTPSGAITPVVREVVVHEATRFDSVGGERAGGFCDTIYSRRITSVLSDSAGFFEVLLPPGKYSFFVREDSLWYANEWDGAGHIQPATVYADSVTERKIDIIYRATF